MDKRTRDAVIGVDMNRMELPAHPGASAIPRAKPMEPKIEAEREAAMDAVINRAMAKVAEQEAEAKVEDADAIRQRLFDQVAGK